MPRAYKTSFIAIALFVLCTPLLGQDACDLQFKLFDNGEAVNPGNSSVSARELKSGSVSWVQPGDEEKVLRNLQPAVYRITVRLTGYRATEFTYRHECSEDSAELKARTIDVPLWNEGEGPSIPVYDRDGTGKLVRVEGQVWGIRVPVRGVADEGAIPKSDLVTEIELAKPRYPAAARAMNAHGAVQVSVILAKDGTVVFAEAISGHPLLRGAAVDAALLCRFKPTLLSGVPVEVSGIIVFNFTK